MYVLIVTTWLVSMLGQPAPQAITVMVLPTQQECESLGIYMMTLNAGDPKLGARIKTTAVCRKDL